MSQHHTVDLSPSDLALARVAYHEAGHAVAFLAAGMRLDRIVGAHGHGACHLVKTTEVPIAGYLAALAAGQVADERWSGRGWAAYVGGGADRRRAHDIHLAIHGTRGSWAAWEDAAGRVLDARWGAVDRLAGALIDMWSVGDWVMAGDQVEELVASV